MIRREFIKKASVTATVPLVAPLLASCEQKESASFSIVYMTDCHISENETAIKGVEVALRKINALELKPDFILNGGDAILDALKESRQQTQQQWDLWHKVVKNNNSLPLYNCIGNHDIWKWERIENIKDKHIQIGKDWAMKELNLTHNYYSFDHRDWHFIVLDSMQFVPKGFRAKIDDEQWDWLVNDLEKSKEKHTCIMSHAPLISFCHQFFLPPNNEEYNLLPKGILMHSDAIRIKNLFQKNPQVKLCLSGHLHMQEEVNYLGVKYLCNGAVCGNWWKGAFHEFTPAFTVIDFFDDGKIHYQWATY